jgi:hypothetical protein
MTPCPAGDVADGTAPVFAGAARRDGDTGR